MKKIRINKDWKFREVFPTISAYTTTYNCIKGNYPFEKAIRSFAWVDQLVIVDGGSTDGTKEKLEELKKEFSNLEVYDIPIDWENPGKDGQQKAMARAMTTSEFVIQFDADEICLGNISKWKRIAKEMQDSIDIVELVVLEPFGQIDMLRLNKEHNPVKWRVFRNKPEITHGIPKHDRLERDGKVYSKGGSDGCFPIHIITELLYPSKLDSAAAKVKSLYGVDKIAEYKDFIVEQLDKETPMVLHLGHLNLHNKILLYLNEWHALWCHLYGEDPDDPKNNIYFPNVAIKECLEFKRDNIDNKVNELIDKTPRVQIEKISELEVCQNMM